MLSDSCAHDCMVRRTSAAGAGGSAFGARGFRPVRGERRGRGAAGGAEPEPLDIVAGGPGRQRPPEQARRAGLGPVPGQDGDGMVEEDRPLRRVHRDDLLGRTARVVGEDRLLGSQRDGVAVGVALAERGELRRDRRRDALADRPDHAGEPRLAARGAGQQRAGQHQRAHPGGAAVGVGDLEPEQPRRDDAVARVRVLPAVRGPRRGEQLLPGRLLGRAEVAQLRREPAGHRQHDGGGGHAAEVGEGPGRPGPVRAADELGPQRGVGDPDVRPLGDAGHPLPDSSVATAAGSVARTRARTHRPSTSSLASLRRPAARMTAGAMSGAAATVSVRASSPEQPSPAAATA